MKAEISVRKALRPLIEWTEFVNGKKKYVPGVLNDEFPIPSEHHEGIRLWVVDFFKSLAALSTAQPSRGRRYPLMQVKLPTPESVLVLDLKGDLTIAEQWDPYRASLVPALNAVVQGEQAWRRLRCCSCNAFFVALNTRAEYCTRECSNRMRQKKFYYYHISAERKRKLKRYHINRIRARAAKRRRPDQSDSSNRLQAR